MTDATTAIAPATAATSTASRLANFPISFFATVMGTAGLSLATHRLELLLGAGHLASLTLGAAAALLFVAVAAVYLAKIARHWDAVVAEWHQPVRLSFFPTVSISLLLLALVALPVDRTAAGILWTLGAVLHFGFSLSILSVWIGHRPFEPPHLNPAWFIPAVGNIIVPLAGVPLGHVEVCWFFFSFGVLFWIVLMALVFNRLIFHDPMTERLLPTLMILVAPPSIGFLAYFKLDGGIIDALARFFFYAALGLFLLVATQVGRMMKISFALSWWAYSFPLAALTTASAVFAEAVGGSVLVGIFVTLYALLATVIAMLVVATVRAVAGGEICRPEH
ncbi:SLAC1 anion channel family protein [Rhodoplanes roseus]|uniref:C4-dicarboxylate ABC transporter n=1 Tax=Rhodoplanes roseus TaxID=29409 RepID=A0A327L7B9_9BRAD|nr:SLAC1 anion channel family protein [Rhodoplanes roseus]RAI45803.1 C4-dicarboxylate ABC transporter [Rhodoplanes roseus]